MLAYHELYTNKLHNLDKIDKLLEIYNLPVIEEIENLNSPISIFKK